MLRAYKYRLYPNDRQRKYFAQSFGNVRKVYNLALDMRWMLYIGREQSVSCNDTKMQIVVWKELYPYLKESNSQSLQYAADQVESAYKRFWSSDGGFPTPKNRRSYNRFHNPQHCSVDWKHGLLNIPKCKDVPIVLHRSFYGTIKDVTVSMEPDGKYYASILVDTAIREVPCKQVDPATTRGLDAGLHTFQVRDDGETVESPHFARSSSDRLGHYQRMLRHMTKGSNNWKKTQRHIASIHSHVANQRRDFLHKLTYRMTHDSQVGTICIEDLDLKEWMKNKYLAYDAADVAVGMFHTFLQYKCGWYGVNLVKIDRKAPSSQTCSVCGHVFAGLRLGQRFWTCECCHTRHDRDFNAAVNIRNFGLIQTLPGDNREVTPVDCPTVDDRRETGLRSSGRAKEKQEKFCGSTDAPVL